MTLALWCKVKTIEILFHKRAKDSYFLLKTFKTQHFRRADGLENIGEWIYRQWMPILGQRRNRQFRKLHKLMSGDPKLQCIQLRDQLHRLRNKKMQFACSSSSPRFPSSSRLLAGWSRWLKKQGHYSLLSCQPDGINTNRSLGARCDPTSIWRPFGPAFCSLDIFGFVLRPLRVLRPCDPRNCDWIVC